MDKKKYILYSSNCPKCIVLKKKLEEAKIDFETIEDEEIFNKKNIRFMPAFEYDNQIVDFNSAIKYIKTQKGD